MSDITELVTKFSFDGNLNILKDYNKEMGQAILQSKKLKGTGSGGAGGGAGSGGGGGGFYLLPGTGGKGRGKGGGVGKAGTAAALSKGISKIAAASAVVVTAAGVFGKQAFGYNKQLGDLLYETNENAEEVTAMQSVAASVGIGRDAFMSNITALSENIANASLNPSHDFNRVGLNIRKDNGDLKTSIEIIKDLRRIFSEKDSEGNRIIDRTQQKVLMTALGLSRDMIRLVTLADVDYSKRLKEANKVAAINAKGADEARIASQQASNLGGTLGKILSNLIVGVTKPVGNMMESLNDLISKHPDTASTAMGAAVGAAAGGGTLFAGIKIAKWLTASGAFARKWASITGAFTKKWADFTVKFGKFGKEGFNLRKASGPSVTKDILKHDGTFTGLLNIVKKTFKSIKDLSRALVRGGKNSPSSFALTLGAALKELPVILGVLGTLGAIIALFAAALKAIGNLSLPSWLATPKNADGRRDSPLNNFLDWLMPEANTAALNPAFAGFGGSTTNQAITINIASDNPDEVGRAVKKAITVEVRDTQRMNNAGGL